MGASPSLKSSASTPVYSVALIGLGRVAAGYGKPGDPASYCHSTGLLNCPRVALAAVADPVEQSVARYAEKWGQAMGDYGVYSGFEALWEAQPCDIVSLCVRGPQHFELMKRIIAAGPRHIFLEKPPTCSLAQADEMVAAAKAAGIAITVSYSRHWSPVNLRLAKLVAEGLIGKVQRVIGYSDPAYLSASCHGLDAMSQFAGYEPVAVYARGEKTGEAPEGYEPDPTMNLAVVEYANGVTGVLHGRAGEHGVFYCDVHGENGFVRSGMYTSPVVRVGKELTSVEELGIAAGVSPFTNAYQQIADYLDGGPLPDCTDAKWHPINELAFAGIDSMDSGCRVELPCAKRERLVFANG